MILRGTLLGTAESMAIILAVYTYTMQSPCNVATPTIKGIATTQTCWFRYANIITVIIILLCAHNCPTLYGHKTSQLSHLTYHFFKQLLPFPSYKCIHVDAHTHSQIHDSTWAKLT